MSVVLQKQAGEIESLRATAGVQFERIARMQAELDLMPTARKRRDAIRAILSAAPGNGDGKRHHRQP